jgi:molecular chaperone DnaK
MADREPIIGIDLGTTNSVVATVQSGAAVVIPSRTGPNLTPSIVAVTTQGKRLVGQLAKRQAITNPRDTVYAAKRLIGRKFSSSQVEEARKRLPYEVIAGEHDDLRIQLGGKPTSVPEISAMILSELKSDAEQYLGQPVKKAVITVPAYFNDGQRQATKDAGKIAGLEVMRILNEPTAAAMAYGHGKNFQGKVAVFDLGGGTFDISILEIGPGVFDVLATGGDTFLGGEDFDQKIIEYLVVGFAKEHGLDLRKEKMALQRLKDAAERAKMELSSTTETMVSLPFIYSPPDGGTALHLQRAISRPTFEGMIGELVARPLEICKRVMEEARVKPKDLKEVVLVGGMTRVPLIIEQVKKFFGREPSKGVHPEEVVALGAALQGHMLTQSAGQVLLLDVTPQSLGVAIAGGYTRTIIPKNTTVPTSATEIFNTVKDQQTTVKIMVLQGEHDIAYKNELLGEFVMEGLRQAPRGEVEIAVTFEINVEGIVSASAKDKDTGQVQSITVTASGGLTEDELKRIMEKNKDELLEARSADEVVAKKAELQSALRDLQELLPRVVAAAGQTEFGRDAQRKSDAALAAAKSALEQRTLEALTDAMDQVSRTLNFFRGVLQRLGSTK